MADQPGFENIGRTGIALETKAPRAWRTLMRTVTKSGPRNLTKANRARARMRRL